MKIRDQKSRRFSTVGAFLTAVIALVLIYLSWHLVSRSQAVQTAPTASSPTAASPAACTFPADFWTDQTGHKRPLSDLQAIEKRHSLWLAGNKSQGERADFHARSAQESSADLSCVDLHGVALQKADLRGAELTGARFVGADLSGAELTGADFTNADLSGAHLEDAHLELAEPQTAKACCCTSSDSKSKTGPPASNNEQDKKPQANPTDLTSAHLNGAHLDRAHLQHALFVERADLRNAILREAVLFGSDLSNANLTRADLSGAQFDAKSDLGETELSQVVFGPTELPDAERVYNARGLQSLSFSDGNKKALTTLRQMFHTDGYDDQAREITYALEHTNETMEWNACLPWKDDDHLWNRHGYITIVSKCAAASINKLVFDLPFQYGMNPNRPLYIVAALWLFCSILYTVIIKTGKRAAIILTCRLECPDGRTIVRRARIVPRQVDGSNLMDRLRRSVWREIAVWRVAFFFSLESALNIGFQEFQFGRWLKLLTTREYDLKGEGWARTLSGAQSLVSLLMLALSIWSLFGQPFSA